MKKTFYITLTILALASLTYAQQDIRPLPHKLQRCRVENGETVVLVNLKDAVVKGHRKETAGKIASHKAKANSNRALAKNGVKSSAKSL